jgi:hypothetical protein
MRRVASILIAAVAMAPGAAMAADCADCHDKVDVKALAGSVHGPKGGVVEPATCLSCHEGVVATDDGHDTPKPVECGRCHAAERDRVAGSAHATIEDRKGASCVDCHGSHAVAKTSKTNHREQSRAMCGRCHERARQEYDASYHGTVRNDQVASCQDCHGSHGVLSRSDPNSSTYRLNVSATCAACHTNPDVPGFRADEIDKVKEYFNSSHGIAVERGGLLVAATCRDCHGSHRIELPGDAKSPVARARIPDTCGKCHVGVLKQYVEGVHGAPFREGNVDVPVCTDCHRSHRIRSHLEPTSSVYATNVSPTCLKCHADTQYVSRYTFPGLRGETYTESYHGAASRLGDPKVANCSSCHGFHDIRKSSDPKSSTYPSNMAATCGRCHTVEDPSRPMAYGKIHLTLAEENHWITGVVRTAYLALIAGSMGVFLLYIALDLRLHFARRRGRV